MISVPESVAFYWRDTVNRAAVNVLGAGKEIPGDLTLVEAERFELASLAARRVQVEYWLLMRSLWSATWKKAVLAHFPQAKLLTYGEHKEFGDQTDRFAYPSAEDVWEQFAVGAVFSLPSHGRLFTGVGLVEEECEGELRFYLTDFAGNWGLTNGLDLGPDWGSDGEDRRVTNPGLLPLARDQGLIDPEPFAALAHSSMKVLAAALAQAPR